MRKVYVLDTNVLLYDPEAIHRFEDNDVVLPIFVIEEVDKFKREQSDRGKNARAVCRNLDNLREQGSLKKGVPTKGGGTISIYIPLGNPKLPYAFDLHNKDQAILQTALLVRNDRQEGETIFITMDTNLRVRSDSYGLKTETYEALKVSVESVTESVEIVGVLSEDIDLFFKTKKLELPHPPHENASLMLKAEDNPNQTALARYSNGYARPLKLPPTGILGVKPRSKEQSFALDLLLDERVNLVTLLGVAGTGKTILAVLAGLQQVLDKKYERLIITRPIVPLGRDLGYLPGSIQEKLDPWMQPIFDNLDYILKASKIGVTTKELLEKDVVKMEPITYIRGRSLAHQFIIADESQNLSLHESKTLISRCGEGTKIVMTGDPFQIDNPYVDSSTNGLSAVAHRFKGQDVAGHVALMKGERSKLADMATKLL